MRDKHKQWRDQLPLLKDIPFPLCYFRPGGTTSTGLHRFSDASEEAYAAVVYFRTVYDSGPPTVSLVAAWTKVAPLKGQFIPRFQFCGAQVLAKLLTNVRTALNIDLEHTHAWSDSTFILHWLDGSPNRFKTFVGNRVSAILN